MTRARMFVVLVAVLASVAGPAHADPVTGPTITDLTVASSYVNPRVGSSAPISVSFASTAWTTVTTTVVDAAGTVVRTLDGRQGVSGSFSTSWDGRDASGAPVADGTYSIVATPAGYVYSSTVGSAGAGAGQFDLPRSVAIAGDGSVWVVDGQNNRLQHFDSSGTFIAQIDASSKVFTNPYTIHFDNSGDLLVSNASRHAYKVDPIDGTVLAQVPLAGDGGADTSPPYSAEIWDLQQMPNGNYIMSGYTGCCPNQPCCGYWSLWEYGSDFSTYIRSWGGQPREQALTILDDSTIVGGSGYDGAWHHFAPAGYQFYGNSSICVPGCRYFGHVWGMTHTTGNNFIASGYESHQIAEFPEANPTPLWTLGTMAAGSGHGQFELPRGIAAKGNDLYIADSYNNRVEHYVRASAVSKPIIVDTQGPSIGGIGVTPSIGGGAMLAATVNDGATGNSPIGAAEYFTDVTGFDGSGHQLNAQDGAFDQSTENVFGFLDPPDGQHTIYVHGRDAAGNWGGYQTIHVLATPVGVIPLPL